jgi:hypothetical protein
MPDRYNLTQVDHESIEGLQPPLLPFSEVDGFLQITATSSRLLEMAVKNDDLFAPSHRKRMEFPGESTIHDQVNSSGTIMSALPCLSVLSDMMINTPSLILGPLMPIASQCQTVAKITRRPHGQSLFVSWLTNQDETYCLGGDFTIPNIITNTITTRPGICRMSLTT